jgi:hypothetical protein
MLTRFQTLIIDELQKVEGVKVVSGPICRVIIAHLTAVAAFGLFLHIA